MPTPPGGDDDQPITIIGGSLDIRWPEQLLWTRITEKQLVYRYSKPVLAPSDPNHDPLARGGKARRVIVTVGDEDSREFTAPSSGIVKVVLSMKKLGASSPRDEVVFTTDATGQNLVLDTKDLPYLAYLAIAPGVLRHPHKRRKVESVTVTIGTTTQPPVLVGSAEDFSVVISCRT